MNKKNILIMVLAMVLVAVVSVGGTMAWLTDKTTEVKNTFTPAGIDIDLTETWNADSDDEDTVEDHWEAQLVPGKEYFKDPEVSVNGNVTDVDVYLFVKFEVANNTFGTDNEPVLKFTSELTETNGWYMMEGVNNVWYREVKTTDDTKKWGLLAGNKVTVNDKLTKELMPTAANTPTLSFTAYAIQTAGFEKNAAGAWAAISK